jgi:hypothetical protein
MSRITSGTLYVYELRPSRSKATRPALLHALTGCSLIYVGYWDGLQRNVDWSYHRIGWSISGAAAAIVRPFSSLLLSFHPFRNRPRHVSVLISLLIWTLDLYRSLHLHHLACHQLSKTQRATPSSSSYLQLPAQRGRRSS